MYCFWLSIFLVTSLAQGMEMERSLLEENKFEQELPVSIETCLKRNTIIKTKFNSLKALDSSMYQKIIHWGKCIDQYGQNIVDLKKDLQFPKTDSLLGKLLSAVYISTFDNEIAITQRDALRETVIPILTQRYEYKELKIINATAIKSEEYNALKKQAAPLLENVILRINNAFGDKRKVESNELIVITCDEYIKWLNEQIEEERTELDKILLSKSEKLPDLKVLLAEVTLINLTNEEME